MGTATGPSRPVGGCRGRGHSHGGKLQDNTLGCAVSRTISSPRSRPLRAGERDPARAEGSAAGTQQGETTRGEGTAYPSLLPREGIWRHGRGEQTAVMGPRVATGRWPCAPGGPGLPTADPARLRSEAGFYPSLKSWLSRGHPARSLLVPQPARGRFRVSLVSLPSRDLARPHSALHQGWKFDPGV